MSKIKARYIVIPLLVCALLGGTAAIGLNKQQNGNYVNVTKVSEANNPGFMTDLATYGGEETSYTGTLKKGSIQYVKVNEQLKIDDILVKKGDEVKKGDKLFTYNLDSLEIALAESENMLNTKVNEIKIAENELAVLKKLQPSENAPRVIEQVEQPVYEPEEETFDEPIPIPEPEPMPEFKYEKKITAKTAYEEGSGTQSEPYVYYVGEDTVVTKDALLMLCPKDKEAKYALFYVCDETGMPMYARLVDGNKIDSEKAADWAVNDGVTKDASGSISFDGGSAGFASFKIQSVKQPEPESDIDMPEGFEGMEGLSEMPEMPEMPEELPQPVEQAQTDTATDTDVSDEITEKDNYIFSKEELKKMITDKEKEIEKLKLEKAEAEIDVRRAKKKLDTGAEFAEFDGKVTFIARDMKHLSENGAYMAVTSSVGTSITSTIGEFSLSKAEIGKKMAITDHESGKEYTGKITYVSDVPLSEEAAGITDTMQSYYEFVVTVEENMDLKENGSVKLEFEEENQGETFALEGVFVRNEGSKYYVMAANSDNIIEKRYVTVGKKWFYTIEVTGGLSKDDRIAVAYGETKEGMQAVDADYYTTAYGTGLF